MDGFAAVIFAIACGIAAAGLVSSLHRAIAGQAAGFRVPAGSAPSVMWAVMLSLFAGPFFIISIALPAGTSTRRFVLRGTAATILALVWSFCSGVVVIQLILWAVSLPN